MKKTFAILGVGFVAGAVAFAIWHKKKMVDTSTTANAEKENAGSEIVNKSASVNDADLAKSAAASVMTERHEEAAQIMKDTVDIICKNSEVSENEGNELEQISSELDELLSED